MSPVNYPPYFNQQSAPVRVKNTVYRNLTGKPLFVEILTTNDATGVHYLYCDAVDGNTTPIFYGPNWDYYNFSIIVPAGYYYQLKETIPTSLIVYWNEVN